MTPDARRLVRRQPFWWWAPAGVLAGCAPLLPAAVALLLSPAARSDLHVTSADLWDATLGGVLMLAPAMLLAVLWFSLPWNRSKSSRRRVVGECGALGLIGAGLLFVPVAIGQVLAPDGGPALVVLALSFKELVFAASGGWAAGLLAGLIAGAVIYRRAPRARPRS